MLISKNENMSHELITNISTIKNTIVNNAILDDYHD